jgi:valyl-tRNA synthetase
LSNQGFVTQAPAEVVQKERDKLTSLQEQAEKLRERLAALAA